MKNKIFIILLICLTVVNISGEEAHTQPVDAGVVNILQNLRNSDGQIDELAFYLSDPLNIVIIDGHNKAPEVTIRDRALVSGEQDQMTSVSINKTDDGRITRFPSANNNTIEITFTVNNKPVFLYFRKDNQKNRYIVFSMKINTKDYNLASTEALPHLLIKSDLNRTTTEVYAILAANPEMNQPERRTQRNFNTRDTSSQNARNTPAQMGAPSIYIMGSGSLTPEILTRFLLQNNPQAGSYSTLARIYVEEAEAEGVNHDIAFAQMCLETGFLRYGGWVQRDWNNFCGLGAFRDGQGSRFTDIRTGVRAHIQHLKAYASYLNINDIIDRRTGNIIRGISPTIEGLSGTWAEDTQYAAKIYSLLQRMYASY